MNPRFARALLLLAAAATVASGPAPVPGPAQDPSPAPRAADRFPQPVRAGDLVGRYLLQPIEAQPVLGRVRQVVRQPGGTLALVVGHGGLLGFGARPVTVPLDDAALLGEHVALVGLPPAQLDALPTATTPGTPLPPDETIRMGLVRPFH